MILDGKTALITGGTKGIGAATALKLAQQGANLVIVGRHNDEQANATISAIQDIGRECLMIVADMAKPESAEQAVAETTQRFGSVDVLFHNAGGPESGYMVDVDPNDWYRAFDIHVHAAFHLCRHAVPIMKKAGEGAIILMASVAALRGFPGAFPYGVVKGAMLQFTRSLARELADDNIRVNSVSPGIIRTAFHAGMTKEAERNSLDNRVPLHRFGTPEQIADAVAMLVTHDYITGQNLVVDGGLTMRMP